MYKNIVRYMTVGEPVIIGARPLKKEEPVEEEPDSEELDEEPEPEPEPETEPEPEPALDKETLEKIFAEIEEIERKSELTEKILQEAQNTKSQAEEHAEEIKQQAEELNRQAAELNQQAEEHNRQAQEYERRAQETLDAARKEAEKIIDDTKAEAAAILEKTRKEGYDTGHAEGYTDGREQGIKDGKNKIEDDLRDTVRQANDKAQKTIQDAKEQTSEYFIRAEDDIVKIVMMAVEKILPQHFLDVPQVILPVVREAISHVRDQREIKIHVEPDSYDLILMARSEFQSMLTSGTAIIEVVSDDALKPGDCVIETPNGGVDARLSTQLGLMRRAVESVLNN